MRRAGFTGDIWPDEIQELLLRAALLPGDPGAAAWVSLRAFAFAAAVAVLPRLPCGGCRPVAAVRARSTSYADSGSWGVS